MTLSRCRYCCCSKCKEVFEKPDLELKLMMFSGPGAVSIGGTLECPRCHTTHDSADIYSGKYDVPREYWGQLPQPVELAFDGGPGAQSSSDVVAQTLQELGVETSDASLRMAESFALSQQRENQKREREKQEAQERNKCPRCRTEFQGVHFACPECHAMRWDVVGGFTLLSWVLTPFLGMFLQLIGLHNTWLGGLLLTALALIVPGTAAVLFVFQAGHSVKDSSKKLFNELRQGIAQVHDEPMKASEALERSEVLETVSCPHCGQERKLRTMSLVGKTILCANCGQTFQS